MCKNIFLCDIDIILIILGVWNIDQKSRKSLPGLSKNATLSLKKKLTLIFLDTTFLVKKNNLHQYLCLSGEIICRPASVSILLPTTLNCQNHWTALYHNGVLELKKKFRGLAELRDLLSLTFSFSGSRVGVKTVSCASSPSPSWPSVLPPQAHTFDIKDINRSRKCFKILREFVIFVASPSPHLWKEDIEWNRKCLQILRQFVIFVASPGPNLPEEHKKRSRKGIKNLRDAVNFVALLGPRPHSSK